MSHELLSPMDDYKEKWRKHFELIDRGQRTSWLNLEVFTPAMLEFWRHYYVPSHARSRQNSLAYVFLLQKISPMLKVSIATAEDGVRKLRRGEIYYKNTTRLTNFAVAIACCANLQGAGAAYVGYDKEIELPRGMSSLALAVGQRNGGSPQLLQNG